MSESTLPTPRDAEIASPDDPLDESLLSLQGKLYSPQQRTALMATLLREIDWQYDYFVLGRRFEVPRLQAWYADSGAHYRYADNFLRHQAWIPSLLSIKHDVENKTGYGFNSVLVTCYRNGGDHVTLHADDEKELGASPVIASLSLGTTREFHYRHKHSGETRRTPLHDGDLLVMHPSFQHEWEHCVPVEPSITTPRINLTFRKVYV